MPSIEAIDRIKNVINSLGNEQAVLNERGTAIEDVLPPSSQPDEDIMDLLEPTDPSDEPASMDSLLDSLGQSDDSDDFDLDAPEALPALDDGLEDFPETGLDDLGDLTDDGDDLGGLDDLEDLNDLGDLTDDGADLGGLDDLGDLADDGDDGDDLGDLDDLDDLDDLTDLEEVSDDPGPADPEEMPDREAALNNLEASLEDEPAEQEEILLDEDFGLNEIEEDFLDDLNEDDSDGGQFSLDDFGGDYNFTDDDMSSGLGLDIDELEKDINRTSEEESGPAFEMEEDELNQLETALHNLPLNLKIALQNHLSNESTPVEQINKMVGLLLADTPIRQITNLYRKQTGKKLEIPRGYEKKSADDFKRERSSLAVFIKETVLPRIGLGLGIFFSLWLLGIVLFNFVYRPLKSEQFYREGEELILQDRYDEGEESFNLAFFGWEIGAFNVRGVPNKEKFFTYADSYKERRQFARAEDKYGQLLQVYPGDTRGQIAYARLLSEKMSRYRDAEYILMGADPLMLDEAVRGVIPYEEIPLREITEIDDLEKLLLLGDNYMDWAREEPDQYEKARYLYATLLRDKPGGNSDEVLLRMLRYFIRTDNTDEVERLLPLYKEKERINADATLQSRVFSELAGWLIDKDRVLESRDFIMLAEKADRTVPDLHYQYARYFRGIYNTDGEKDALTNALGFLSRGDYSDGEHLFMKIDSHRRLGYLAAEVGDYPAAEDQYLLALRTYENSRRLNLIGSSPTIGALYSELGNLNYDWYGNYEKALEYYRLAEENFAGTPEIQYKKGFIHYGITGNYQEGLYNFYQVSRYYPTNRNLLLAMGNTLLERGDYYGAVSHYEQLLGQLKREEENIKVLLPDEKDEEWALIEYMFMAYNNLGVAQYGVAAKTPNKAMENRALSSLTRSSEYFDMLLRNRETSVKTDVPDLAAQNRQLLISRTDGEISLEPYRQLLPRLEDIPTFFK